MAVLVEAFSVVVRIKAIESHFVGGLKAFSAKVPNATLCADDHLIRVGFMDSGDVRAYVEMLESQGLTFKRDEIAVDLVVVDQFTGPTVPASWLQFKRVEMEGMTLSICWLTDDLPKSIVCPPGWKYESSMSATAVHVKDRSQIGERFRYLRNDNGVDVYLDLQTSKEVYTGRPTVSGDTESALHTQISAIVRETLALDAKGPIPKPRFWGKKDLRYVRLKVELLPQVQRIVEGPGSEMMLAHYAQGLIYRVLGRFSDAEKALIRANALTPGTTAILRDLVLCIGQQNRPHEALPFAREAVAIDPVDPSLLGNLAACLMSCKRDDEALEAIYRALAIDLKDPINLRILTAIKSRKR